MENAVEAADSNEEVQISVTEINRLGYIPPFDPEDPETWFFQLEEQFKLNRINNDATKFWLVITKLSVTQAKKIRNIIDNPPKKDMYLLLKRELLQHSFKQTCQRDRKHKETRGDASLAFLMEVDASNAVCSSSNNMLRSKEPSFQEIIHYPGGTQKKQLLLPEYQINDIFRSIEALRHEIVELRQSIKEVLQSRRGSGSSVRQNATTEENSTTVKVQSQDAVCWYHQKFGKRSTRCIQPCEFPMSKENDCS